ncbi:YrdB family protein [Bacillus velezensis]|uniref:YrdB family protein n=1 Tax=Bacillus TaxID=1386 RepID=UPI001C52C2CE|nr:MULTISPECIES: YrdB family protein [Bacillus amyloliquefaciens group]MED1923014.1 YrdB family protein [Bacillus velezensis]MED3657122.1 YrdB family protein [Bacillus velezensis]QXP98307.1 YrdB family protein [Bacillus velezensis]UHH04132.1 YrdB family protein [Bacillus amyloliquefaciens]ULR23861.1 YrdB family protein [Bacillus velezensis]
MEKLNQTNLLLRFALEIAALICIGVFAWSHFNGFLRYVLTLVLPIVAMLIWTVFAVPNDPSRSGQTVIAVNGVIRLIIELLIFAIAVAAIYFSDLKTVSIIFFCLIILHYIASVERIKWLLNQ